MLGNSPRNIRFKLESDLDEDMRGSRGSASRKLHGENTSTPTTPVSSKTLSNASITSRKKQPSNVVLHGTESPNMYHQQHHSQQQLRQQEAVLDQTRTPTSYNNKRALFSRGQSMHGIHINDDEDGYLDQSPSLLSKMSKSIRSAQGSAFKGKQSLDVSVNAPRLDVITDFSSIGTSDKQYKITHNGLSSGASTPIKSERYVRAMYDNTMMPTNMATTRTTPPLDVNGDGDGDEEGGCMPYHGGKSSTHERGGIIMNNKPNGMPSCVRSSFNDVIHVIRHSTFHLGGAGEEEQGRPHEGLNGVPTTSHAVIHSSIPKTSSNEHHEEGISTKSASTFGSSPRLHHQRKSPPPT